MSTQQSATILVSNQMGGSATLWLFHSNSSNGTQSGNWAVSAGQSAGPLTVYFLTGWGSETILDYWSILVQVHDGPNAGFYVNTGSVTLKYWKECQLQHADAGETITLSVSPTTFDVALRSGGCTDGMAKIAPAAAKPITHVFVVMLENHSFDNMFAMSGIDGIDAATTSDCNSYGGETYCVQKGAPLALLSDPGHEFDDVVEQLGGVGAQYPPGGPYPAIDNSGFAANYATSVTEGKPTPAPPGHVGDIMACFVTPDQLPALHQLATGFALCDHWHSSLPGPTWPNRFFVHGASSSGLDDSPSTAQIVGWEVPGEGFKYPNGSIYDALGRAGIPYRFYNDSTGFPDERSLYSDDPGAGSPGGAIPQVSSLSGVTILDINSLKSFASDLQGPYPYPYTFIEPHYGDVTGDTYVGGSSQHPMDDVYGGEHLLAAVYGAIRSSPYWQSSLLIVTYDEHGGYYDCVRPPGAKPPGDDPTQGYNCHGFVFDQYGVRVPAVIVSPLIDAQVDHTLYDHSSVAKTLEDLWGLPALTQRDANATSVLHLVSQAQPRADYPATLQPPPPRAVARPTVTAAARARLDAEPVPETGNLRGTLAAAMKAEIELSGGSPAERAAIAAKVEAIRTKGDARAYLASVMEKVGIARAQRELARRAAP